MTVMGVTKESENILSELLEAVKSADSEAKKKAWAGVQDPDVLDTLADEWKRDSERISTMLSTIESVPGQVNKARNLRSAIKRLADERMQKIIESQVTMMEQEMLALCTMSAALGASAPPANVVEKSILDMLCAKRL